MGPGKRDQLLQQILSAGIDTTTVLLVTLSPYLSHFTIFNRKVQFIRFHALMTRRVINGSE